jgi:hypothetical protein
MVTKCLRSEYLTYEGISNSSWPESLGECMVTIVNGHCCLSSYSGFRISATARSTAGTDILESHVRQQMFVNFRDSWNRWPCNCDFIHGNDNKSQGKQECGGPQPCF